MNQVPQFDLDTTTRKTAASAKERILESQQMWAARAGLQPDSRGYLATYEQNLFQPLSDSSRTAFDQGSGSELSSRPTGPAKMCALHSSSALAANFFDPWVGNDTQPLAEIFGLESKPTAIRLEGRYPTGLPGNPPNVDVVLELGDGCLIGIESKFTEWLTPKPASAQMFKDKYFPSGTGVWEKVGLPNMQRLAEDIRDRAITFRHLDAPQLAKHALGLATHVGRNFRLFYVYFDAVGRESMAHTDEINMFRERLRAEVGFSAFTYQELIARLSQCSGARTGHLAYLKARYGEVIAASI